MSASEPLHADVIVVGDGPVGLAAALVLGHRQAHVVVVGEQAADFIPTEAQPYDARVYALSHRSKQFLQDIKVWGAIPQERIQAVPEMQVWGDAEVGERGHVHFRALDAGLDALTWIVEQQAIVTALAHAVGFSPTVQRVGSKVLGMAKEANGWAVITPQQTLRAPLVIAADGAQSLIRRHAGLDFAIRDYSADGVVCTFDIEKPHLGIARQWFMDDSVLALLPLPGQRVSMVWSMPWSQSERLKQLSAESMTQLVMDAAQGEVARLCGQIRPAGGVAAFPLRHGVADRWADNGVVLMGDAAHVIHPLAGQGLNLGLEDVAAVRDMLLDDDGNARKLAVPLHHPQRWRRWERRRKLACEPLHLVTDGLHTLFRLQLPGTQWARNKGMGVLNKVPVVKRWLIEQAIR